MSGENMQVAIAKNLENGEILACSGKISPPQIKQAQKWIAENKNGRAQMNSFRELSSKEPFEEAGAKIRNLYAAN